MKKINKYIMTLVLAFGFVLFTGAADLAAESQEEQIAQPVANVSIGAHGLTFRPKVEYAGLAFAVSTPGGAVFSKTFDSGTTPYFELSELGANSILDGSYTFELLVIPFSDKMARTSGEAAGFEDLGVLREDALVQNGYFTVQGGSIVTVGAAQEGLAKPLDIVHLDDVIIEFSLCVGNDCVNGESFGFDTIRLKENNLRLHFDDTSTSASFPRNDWRIIINDSSNGGASYFGVEDSTAGRRVFTLEAGAPAHSLYVDDGGRLGLGTSTPVVNAHIKEGNTPTLRLEQDGSSGFTPQTWDVAGNEANFFIRDATNGSKLPFKIQPNAPTESIFIKNDGIVELEKGIKAGGSSGIIEIDGIVGIGTDSPSFPLEIETTGEDAGLLLDRTDGATFKLNVSTTRGQIGTQSNHDLRFVTNNTSKMVIEAGGDVGFGVNNPTFPIEHSSGAHLTTGGAWTNGSSMDYKENIADLSADEAMEALDELNPVTFEYKKEKGESYVGFIAEEVPELVAQNDRKSLSTMDVVAVLTKVVKEQQATISKLNERIEKLEKVEEK